MHEHRNLTTAAYWAILMSHPYLLITLRIHVVIVGSLIVFASSPDTDFHLAHLVPFIFNCGFITAELYLIYKYSIRRAKLLTYGVITAANVIERSFWWEEKGNFGATDRYYKYKLGFTDNLGRARLLTTEEVLENFRFSSTAPTIVFDPNTAAAISIETIKPKLEIDESGNLKMNAYDMLLPLGVSAAVTAMSLYSSWVLIRLVI